MAIGECRMAIRKCRIAIGECRIAIGECRMAIRKCRIAIGECRTAIGKCRSAIRKCRMAIGADIPRVNRRLDLRCARIGLGGRDVIVGNPISVFKKARFSGEYECGKREPIQIIWQFLSLEEPGKQLRFMEKKMAEMALLNGLGRRKISPISRMKRVYLIQYRHLDFILNCLLNKNSILLISILSDSQIYQRDRGEK